MVYLVNMNFLSMDSYYSYPIGVFSSEEVAKYHKEKWELFFKIKKVEIFGKYNSSEYIDTDGDLSEQYENEFYTDKMVYNYIYDFQDVTIQNFELDRSVVFESLDKDLIREWNTVYERDNKIDNLLK